MRVSGEIENACCQTPVMKTSAQAKNKTTIVRIAVATVESVVLIPHFASTETKPAKNAEPNANQIHKSRFRFLRNLQG